MTLLALSFFAGILTVLAPCVFPLLPVIIGGSMSGKSWKRPLIITLSLATSVVVFTLLLQLATKAFSVSPDALKWISGGILILFGLSFVFPKAWSKIMHATGMEARSQQSLAAAGKKEGVWGLVLMGASLGPVFSSCSPTYGYIVATVLNQSVAEGLTHLIAYSLGLAFILGIIAIGGRAITAKLKWAVDPNGAFRKVIGVLFLIVGVAIITGLDKKFEAYVVTTFSDTFVNLVQFEQKLVDVAVGE